MDSCPDLPCELPYDLFDEINLLDQLNKINQTMEGDKTVHQDMNTRVEFGLSIIENGISFLRTIAYRNLIRFHHILMETMHFILLQGK